MSPIKVSYWSIEPRFKTVIIGFDPFIVSLILVLFNWLTLLVSLSSFLPSFLPSFLSSFLTY